MRCATDVGGTFTDLVVEQDNGKFRLYKQITHPEDPYLGVMDTLALAAEDLGLTVDEFLNKITIFTHSTSRALNAILTGNTAKTALITTKGHPDILLFREGGRSGLFDYSKPYPDPYIPRAQTYELNERILANGDIYHWLDKQELHDLVGRIKAQRIEAVAVCLLWSIVNPDHEIAVGECLQQLMPDVPFTLSHQINPVLREYRRASSTCIDASLKPLMTHYLESFAERLGVAGFSGRLLGVTSKGGLIEIADLAQAPIHAINSGPSMAPIAGRFFTHADLKHPTAIVVDTGGTSFDVSLVRDGRIPMTSELWMGAKYSGHLSGFPSVDVKCQGAGGGSIAEVDSGGLLKVGPESAGSVPGPACYQQGGEHPTVTDAALVLGYIDPAFYLGGRMTLDLGAAWRAMEKIALPLGTTVEEAALAVIELATENMLQSVEEITVNQGIVPASCVMVAGGGAAGLNAVAIARRLDIPKVIFPFAGSVLSAFGALVADLSMEFKETLLTTSDRFDFNGVKAVIEVLYQQCAQFFDNAKVASLSDSIELAVEAHYNEQVWNIEVLLDDAIQTPQQLQHVVENFHRQHQQLYAVHDPDSSIEFVSWIARARRTIKDQNQAERAQVEFARDDSAPWIKARHLYVAKDGWINANIYKDQAVPADKLLAGPLIIESETTTIIVPTGATMHRSQSGSLIVTPS